MFCSSQCCRFLKKSRPTHWGRGWGQGRPRPRGFEAGLGLTTTLVAVTLTLKFLFQELRRIGCFAIQRTPSRQTRIPLNVGGYTIPAGTGIHPVFSSVVFDETLFPEPEKFMPERWLTSDDKLNKPEYMIGFGVGKRMCLGEQMSRMMDFLIVANLIHEFEVEFRKSIILQINSVSFSFEPSIPPIRHPMKRRAVQSCLLKKNSNVE